MLRPLAVRLTMAFLCVGVVGALLVAFIASQRTRLEFDRFVALGRGNPRCGRIFCSATTSETTAGRA